MKLLFLWYHDYRAMKGNMLWFRFGNWCLLGIDTRVVGGFFGNSLPKNYFNTVWAVFINVVKCAYFSSLERCDVGPLENGYIQNNWKRYFKEGERTKYFCNKNYRTENEDGEITCSKNGWSPTPRCIRKGERAYFLSQFLTKTNKSTVTSPMLIPHHYLVQL